MYACSTHVHIYVYVEYLLLHLLCVQHCSKSAKTKTLPLMESTGH